MGSFSMASMHSSRLIGLFSSCLICGWLHLTCVTSTLVQPFHPIISSKKHEAEATFIRSDTWPTLYKAGEKQVANMLWFEEGLYADLPYGYVDNLTEFYTSENNKHVQQVKFPPRLYYPISQTNDAFFGDAVLSQISEQMEPERMMSNRDKSGVIIYPATDIKKKKRRQRPLRKNGENGGALQTLKSLAFSLLDQWLFSTTEEKNRNGRFNNNDTKEIANSGNSHPMRYLFLLGVLPTTFGSLYSLGYTPLQIMVIGAYIVTSYFIFVEENPDKNKEDIYDNIEEILSTVIQQLPVSDEENVTSPDEKFTSILDKNETKLDFELSGFLDEKSQNFIKKYDDVMTKVFNVERKI